MARLEAEAAQAGAAAEVLDDLEARVLESNAALEARSAENAALKEQARAPFPPGVLHFQGTSPHTPAGRSNLGSAPAQARGLSQLCLHAMVPAPRTLVSPLLPCDVNHLSLSRNPWPAIAHLHQLRCAHFPASFPDSTREPMCTFIPRFSSHTLSDFRTCSARSSTLGVLHRYVLHTVSDEMMKSLNRDRTVHTGLQSKENRCTAGQREEIYICASLHPEEQFRCHCSITSITG